MNKLLIVFLAVCLVSTHAFVKRDAPAEQTGVQKEIAEALAKLADISKKIVEETGKALDPDVIQKKLQDAVTAAQQALEKFKPAPATPEPQAA